MTSRAAFREKGIYRLVNAGLLAGVALFGAEHFLGIGDMTFWLALEAAVILGLLFGINFLPLRGKFLCLSAAALGVGMAVSAAGLEESFQFLRGYFPWLMGTGEGYGTWARGYGALQTAIIVLLCYLLQIFLERVPRMKYFFAALLFVGALFCLFEKKTVSHWGMAFGISYIVTVYAEWEESRWRKARGGSLRAYLLWIMPFLAVYFLLVGCMPTPETPFEWRLVKNIYAQIREAFQLYTQEIKWGSREGFDMAFSGFSEDAGLGGGLLDYRQEDAVMTVQQLNISRPVPVYLTGTVYDAFDGRAWRQIYRGGPEGVFLDTAETLYAVRAYDGQYQMDYLHSIKLQVRYRDFNTGYVFAPLKTREIRSLEKELTYTCEGGSLCLESYRGYGTAYELQYYQMNSGQEAFYRFLEECSGESAFSPEEEAAWIEMGTFEAADLAAHRQEIYENYLGEVRLSEDVAAYLGRITQGAETDVEKLRAIERELASFVYTRSPGNLPQWVGDESEFLDYFLLESRQGYCTYFATAFVLLCRAEGIPARYVQGFCVPAQEGEEIPVYSHMAHAWPEAYLVGVGWIPFEPTPGYGDIRFAPWELKKPDATEETGETEENGGSGGSGEFRETGEEPRPEEAPESETPEEERKAGRFRKVLGYTVPAVLAGYAVLLLLDNAWSRYRYRRMSPEKKFRLEVSQNLRILALLGTKRGECETLQELRYRCGQQAKTAALRFIEDYESVVYGGQGVSAEMIDGAVRERTALLEQLKQEKRWMYIRWHFLLNWRRT